MLQPSKNLLQRKTKLKEHTSEHLTFASGVTRSALKPPELPRDEFTCPVEGSQGSKINKNM